MSWQVLGITLHAYGLVIGVALLIAYGAARWAAHHAQISHETLARITLWCVLCGVVGARVWHVVTDWQLYQGAWWHVFAVWQGGLSIIGAVLGGLVGLSVAVRGLPAVQRASWTTWLDIVALSLPIGQCVGRIGNALNGELYGLTTTLPWGIWIDGVQHHPLFAYEMIVTGSIALWLWWWEARQWSNGRTQIGHGKYWHAYLLTYGAARFLLDFLRIDRGPTWAGLGFNQWIMLGVMTHIGILMMRKYLRHTRLLLLMMCCSLFFTGCFPKNLQPHSEQFKMLQTLTRAGDHSTHFVWFDSKELAVEVVNTSGSLEQGLSGRSSLKPFDGMLFVLPETQIATFWMKDMQFPLDMVWLDEQGVVVGVTAQVTPDCDTSLLTDTNKHADCPDEALRQYHSPSAVRYVLELPAGKAAEYHLQVGSKMQMSVAQITK